MQANDTNLIGRRPVLKGAAVALAGLGGLTGTAGAKKGGKEGENGKGLQPLEDKPSLTGSFVSPGAGTQFVYPAPTTFAQGQVFDTTSADITPDGNVIHYQLAFDLNEKPYGLTHVGGGKYVSRGAVVNFKIPGQNAFGLTAGEYRATVRDDVNLYGKDEYFDWSVTRIDFFTRPEINYAGSAMVVVWDEDGSENGNPFVRNDPTSVNQPEFSQTALPNIYQDIDDTAKTLMAAGPSNPGGQ